MSNCVEISLSAARRVFLAGVQVALIDAQDRMVEILERGNPQPGRRLRRGAVRFFHTRVRDVGAKTFLIKR